MANTTRTTIDLWTYDQAVLGVDKTNFIGYEVVALDGSIGKVRPKKARHAGAHPVPTSNGLDSRRG